MHGLEPGASYLLRSLNIHVQKDVGWPFVQTASVSTLPVP